MQLPKASRDLLMLAPSSNLSPLFLVTEARSEPARSMTLRVATVQSSTRPAVLGFRRMLTLMTACEREETALASVPWTVRWEFPDEIKVITSDAHVGVNVERPGTETDELASRRFKTDAFGLSKSRIVSL